MIPRRTFFFCVVVFRILTLYNKGKGQCFQESKILERVAIKSHIKFQFY
jgi:hypothetical protein